MGRHAASAYAGRGKDVVYAGDGNSFLLGGSGNDTLYLSGDEAAYSMTIDKRGLTHINRIDGTQGEVIERGFEHIRFADALPTDDDANAPTNNSVVLFGGANDLIEGSANDLIEGRVTDFIGRGVGHFVGETVPGDSGEIIADSGIDTVGSEESVPSDNGTDTRPSGGGNTATDGGSDSVSGATAGRGGTVTDTVTGGNGTIAGGGTTAGGGNVIVSGGTAGPAGPATVPGGADDSIGGDGASDPASGGAAAPAGTDTMAGGAGGATSGHGASDTVSGGAAAPVGTGTDTMAGGAGGGTGGHGASDTVSGGAAAPAGAGTDTMAGGAGGGTSGHGASDTVSGGTAAPAGTGTDTTAGGAGGETSGQGASDPLSGGPTVPVTGTGTTPGSAGDTVGGGGNAIVGGGITVAGGGSSVPAGASTSAASFTSTPDYEAIPNGGATPTYPAGHNTVPVPSLYNTVVSGDGTIALTLQPHLRPDLHTDAFAPDAYSPALVDIDGNVVTLTYTGLPSASATNTIVEIGSPNDIGAFLDGGGEVDFDVTGTSGKQTRLHLARDQTSPGKFNFVDESNIVAIGDNNFISGSPGKTLAVGNSKQANLFDPSGDSRLVPGAEFSFALTAKEHGAVVAGLVSHVALS